MELLGVMHNACYQRDNAKQIVMTAVKSKKDLFLIYQNPDVSNMDYLWCFKALFNVIHAGVIMAGYHPGLT